MSHDKTTNEGRRLFTIRNLAKTPGYAQAFSESSLRHLVFDAKPRKNSKGEAIDGNGLAQIGAILHVGRKILIDLDRFDSWLDRQRTSDPSLLRRVRR